MMRDYGGKDIKVTDNAVSDTVAFGAGISVSTQHNPVPFERTVLVERNTFIRTGGREHNWPADFGGLSPSLTTVSQNILEKGHAAVRMLLDQIDGNPIEERRKVLPVDLIIRETTAPAKVKS